MQSLDSWAFRDFGSTSQHMSCVNCFIRAGWGERLFNSITRCDHSASVRQSKQFSFLFSNFLRKPWSFLTAMQRHLRAFGGIIMSFFATMQLSNAPSVSDLHIWSKPCSTCAAQVSTRSLVALLTVWLRRVWLVYLHCICEMRCDLWARHVWQDALLLLRLQTSVSTHLSAWNLKNATSDSPNPFSSQRYLLISLFFTTRLCNGRHYQLRIRPHLSWEIQR